jgi:hypothetical protein
MTALPVLPTPRPEEGVVSFNINTACNYRCSYCTQRFKEDRGRWVKDTPRFLAAFARLPGRWEVKLSGGEPFVHPTLLDLVSGLADLGHRVSVVTNFSAKQERIAAFIEAARGRVGIFSASLHLEYVDTEHAQAAFIAKAQETQRALLAAHRDASLPRPSFCVTSVATRAVLPGLPALRARFRDAGITFKVQPEKQDRDVVPYTPEEEAAILALGGHNDTQQVVHRYRGLPCWAGARYFILDDEGNAFRCYPARRYRLERMGNFLDETFPLEDGPKPCLYATCNCTVPIGRRMMPQKEPPLEVLDLP